MRTSLLFGQCQDTADFNAWFEGHQYKNWEVIDQTEVWDYEEIFPVTPTFFVSNSEFINVRISFDVVSSNGSDNDFIGFVVGYKGPLTSGSNHYEMVLFDWKAEAETAFSNSAQEGFNLTQYHGNIPEANIHDYFWGHNGLTPNPIITPIAHSYGNNKGWITGKKYHFEVLYSTGSIEIYLDGNILFDVRRCNQPGRVGFYTYSQHDVTFSNFTWKAAADAFFFPKEICQGDPVFFSLEDTLCGGYNPLIQSWKWIFDDGDSISNIIDGYHTYEAPGNYHVKMIAEFPDRCYDTVNSLIKVQPPITVDLGPDTTLPANSSITLTAGPDLFGYDYLWSTGNMGNQLILTDLTIDTVVGVMVTYLLCSASDEILIKIEENPVNIPEVYIPNAFTPDGDGINDEFLPVFGDQNIENYKLFVYNRWGAEIFHSNDPSLGWNGRSNGIIWPADVYVYFITYQTAGQVPDSSPLKRKGNVVLLK